MSRQWLAVASAVGGAAALALALYRKRVGLGPVAPVTELVDIDTVPPLDLQPDTSASTLAVSDSLETVISGAAPFGVAISKRWLVIAAVAAGGMAVCALAVYLHRRRRFNAVTDFMEVGTVSQLNLYPVKSMKGIQVDEIDCRRVGGKNGENCDRKFMVMDLDTGRVVSSKEFNKMVTIKATVKDNCLILSDDHETVSVSIKDVETNHVVRRTLVYDGLSQDGLDCGNEVSEFLQKVLETDKILRVVYHIDGLYSERDFIPKANETLSVVSKRRDKIAYQNDCSYHVICNNTIKNLNSHLNGKCTVDMRRFRPILQIEGPPAFDEDMWSEMRIGNVVFTFCKPCTRCVRTTIDPDAGARLNGNEPLTTLCTYRLAPGRLRRVYKQRPLLGVHMGLKGTGGVIKVGDKVFARYKTHPY